MRRGIPFIIAVAAAFCLGRAAWATEPFFTEQDAARQKAFLAALEDAVRCVTTNDRAGARKALRRASAAGAYTLAYARLNLPCGGRSAFVLPEWVMTAQAALGDVAGAKEIARSAGGANETADALFKIAQAQLRTPAAFPPSLTFDEAQSVSGHFVGASTYVIGGLTYKTHDFSSLKRLFLPPDRAGAWTTLRNALPDAEASDRASAAYLANELVQQYLRDRAAGRNFSERSLLLACPSLNDAGRRRQLAERQAEIGDYAGARRTLARLKSPAERTAALFGMAVAAPDAAAARMFLREARTQEKALRDPYDRADVLGVAGERWQGRGKTTEAQIFFRRATQEAMKITDPHWRFHAQQSLFSTIQNVPGAEGDWPEIPPEARATLRIVLRNMRTAILALPEPSATIAIAPGDTFAASLYDEEDPPRFLRLDDLAYNQGDVGWDIAGARETTILMRRLLARETDPARRAYFERRMIGATNALSVHARRLGQPNPRNE